MRGIERLAIALQPRPELNHLRVMRIRCTDRGIGQRPAGCPAHLRLSCIDRLLQLVDLAQCLLVLVVPAGTISAAAPVQDLVAGLDAELAARAQQGIEANRGAGSPRPYGPFAHFGRFCGWFRRRPNRRCRPFRCLGNGNVWRLRGLRLVRGSRWACRVRCVCTSGRQTGQTGEQERA